MKKLLILCLSLTITACAVSPDGSVGMDKRVFNKENTIPLGAGILGAVVCNKLFDGHGSKEGWTAACGIAGYFASTAFMKKHNATMESNKTGQTTHWEDPDGKQHSLTPTRTYYQGEAPCREFRQTVEIDGATEIMTGEACRQSDGTWALVNS